MKNEEFLYELLNKVSVSGAEEESQDFVADHMKPFADEILRDDMGDVVCVLNPEAKTRILLAGHGDEIGLMVNYITPEGFLHVTNRGGIITHTYPGQQVKIMTRKGVVYGSVAISRQLLKKEDLSAADLLIDIGAKDEADAKNLVELGDVAVLDTEIRKMANGKFTARALDDRLGVFIVMEAFKRARERGCKVGVYSAATVGEETAESGAYFTSSRVEPDLAVVVDVTWASDCPDTKPENTGKVKLGGGPVLCYAPIIPRKYNKKLEEIAAKAGIPFQIESASRNTSTDGDTIHFTGKGVPVVLVSIPLRYMHSPAEVADEKDVEGCIELITRFLMDFPEA